MSVIYNGQEYRGILKDGVLTLDLSGIGTKSITEIKGLETLTDLQILKLSNNQISEIKGLETLSNLRDLDLSHNKISEIQGLKNLVNLERLNLEGNRFVSIKGFENLINLKKLILGLSHWDVDARDWVMYGKSHTLKLNGKELTGIEKYVVKPVKKGLNCYL